MNIAPTLATGAWLVANLPSWRSYKYGLMHPAATQWAILRRSLQTNSSSAYGRTHGFSEIHRYEQFRERVPIVAYEALEPWIARIIRGEAGVLTCKPVTRLIPTSGSSGGCKLIPFTAALQREFNRAIGPWMVDLHRQHPALILGPSYWSISPCIPAPSGQKSAVPVGFDDDSAYLGGIRQRLVESTFAVSPALRLASSMETFRYLTLLSLLRQPTWSFASVWHPSFLALLLDALPACWDELLEDVDRGGCRRATAERSEIRSAVQAPPQPRRARELHHIGAADLSAIWPRLHVVSCWGHGHAALSLRDLQTRLPHISIQPKGLLATEAFVSIPFQARHPLAITSHFFEFADADGRISLAHELQPGRCYTVVVTTAGGLWRYRLGDLVEVDGFVGNTPSIRFVGRGEDTSDLCGEKLTETFVAQSLQAVCQIFGFRPTFALLAPEPDTNAQPNYMLFVEGTPPCDFLARLDEELRHNPHYAVCRDLGQLGPPRSFQILGGAYQTYCRVHLAEGRRLGDIKPQSFSPRTDWKQQFMQDA